MQQQATSVCEFSIFVVLSVITAPHNVLTSAKSIWLLFHLMYVKSNWIDAQKISQGKREATLREGGSPTPPAKP